jgi:hypothetical protein
MEEDDYDDDDDDLLNYAINLWECLCGLEQLRLCNELLRDGRSGVRIPIGAMFFVQVQTGSGAQPDSVTIGTGSYLGINGSGRGVAWRDII